MCSLSYRAQETNSTTSRLVGETETFHLSKKEPEDELWPEDHS